MKKYSFTKENIDSVRGVEGFPIAKDDDIINLSNAPYFTACPNPFIEDFIELHGQPYVEETDDYHCEPFAADVTEGKGDPLYNAHMYHTKVPYKAIMRYILHYTKPGDIVFDGFCGTGMTGVAAQMCGVADDQVRLEMLSEQKDAKWGLRYSILNDLSPAASFIAHNNTSPSNVFEYSREMQEIIEACEKECGWMYQTNHVSEQPITMFDDANNRKGTINYIVWSEVIVCPHCGRENIFWDMAWANPCSSMCCREVKWIRSCLWDLTSFLPTVFSARSRVCKRAIWWNFWRIGATSLWINLLRFK